MKPLWFCGSHWQLAKALVALTTCVPPVLASDVELCFVAKSVSYLQSADGPPSLWGEEAFGVNAAVSGADSEAILSATITSPAGPLAELTRDLSEGWLEFEAAFDTLAELNAQVPDDSKAPYLFTISTLHDGPRTIALTMDGAAYPSPPPQVLHYGTLQTIAPAQPLTLSWTGFAGGTADDLILVEVSQLSGAVVFETGIPGAPESLNGLATSITLPSGTLKPGQRYDLSIEFIKVVDRNESAYPGAVGYALYIAETSLQIATTGSPSDGPTVGLGYYFTQNNGFMEIRNSGTLTAIMNPDPLYRYFLNVTVTGSSFPSQVRLHGPAGSGLEDVASTGFFQWTPDERIYVTPDFHVPPYPSGGGFVVDVGGQPHSIQVADPAAAVRKVLAVPTLTVTSSGALTAIDWTYQDATGRSLMPPSYVKSVSIRLNGASPGPNLYGVDNLAVSPGHHLLNPAPSWPQVTFLTFELTDDLGNIYQSAFQKAVDPVITMPAIPELAREVPFSINLTAFGGQPPLAWSPAGFMPGWLSLSAEGVLSASSPSPMSFGTRFRVQDAAGHSAEKDYVIRVYTPGARDAFYYAVQKRRVYRQTSPLLAEFPAGPGRYEFAAVIGTMNSLAISNASLTAGTGEVLRLEPGVPPQTNRLHHTASFPEKDVMDSHFPAGSRYRVDFDTLHDGPRHGSLDLPADQYPPAPFITNLAQAQLIDTSRTFMLAYAPWPEGTTNDFVRVQIFDARTGAEVAGYGDIFEVGAYDATFRPSFAINPGWLQAGQRYSACVSFIKMAGRINPLDNGEYPGVAKAATFTSATEFDISSALTYAAWLNRYFDAVQQANPEVTGPDRDPDQDGLVNVLEYAFGRHPQLPDNKAHLAVSLGAGRLALSYTLSSAMVDYAHELQGSRDLRDWSPVAALFPTSPLSIDVTRSAETSTETHQVTLSATQHYQFFRVAVWRK